MSGPLPAVLAPVSLAAAQVYGLAVRWRNRRFDRPNAVQRLDVPVISIGNVTAGGTGKSPVVRWVARELLTAGRFPAIAMRGYRAAPGAAGDEEREHRDQLPAVPVIASPDRYRALQTFFQSGHEPRCDCVILDDGFQHRQLHRDLDIVLIDAQRNTLEDRLLPAGYLREPLASLRRADVVIVTRAAHVDSALGSAIEQHHGRVPLAWARHAWKGLVQHDERNPEGLAVPLERLNGLRVTTAFGVGHPAAVRDQLLTHGPEIAANIPLRDHAAIDATVLARIAEAAQSSEALIVTGKDWVKLREVLDWSRWSRPVLVPVLEAEIFAGSDALLTAVRAAANLPADPSKSADAN